jgi:hypothetical protein
MSKGLAFYLKIPKLRHDFKGIFLISADEYPIGFLNRYWIKSELIFMLRR